MERREFLAALACLGALPRKACGAIPYPVHFHKPNPYEAVLAHVEAGTDEFRFEKEATEIEGRLTAMLGGHALPLSPDFEGAAPLPRRYRVIAEGVSEAEYAEFVSGGGFQEELAHWIRSLGRPRRARFFVLPDNLVRYEIASDGAYRTGLWKQVWQDGRLRNWHPLSETITTASQPMFQDITSHSFARAESFHEQMRKGNTWWRSRLDAATGIDIYGNNGVAVGDIDGDGWDEIYVCQPAGLPNRLYKNRGDATFRDITEEAGLGVLDDKHLRPVCRFPQFGQSGSGGAARGGSAAVH